MSKWDGSIKKKTRQDEKKKNTLLLIDAENVSYKKADVIMGWVELQGVIAIGKVYGRQKDPHVKGWFEKAREYDLEEIRLYGPPEKDKVDKKIQRDARREISVHKNLDIVCLVTSDSGYVDMIDELRSQGKRVVVIGEEKASEALRKSCSQFIEI
ncbi:MAG: NYN domain-containing protein [Lachnospiraceae bacterium]|nr:NYN domain-containing protein [Lachnospiraceae bacterium]